MNAITIEQIAAATGCGIERAEKWLPHLYAAMQAYEINTLDRQAAFLAQIGHESGNLRYTREIWGPTPAQKRYEGRDDLGNEYAGDGFKYRGRGLIQITGRANYLDCSLCMFNYPSRLLTEPETLEQPKWAAMSAAWFWASRGLNELADKDDFEGITRKINGGLNGYTARFALWKSAKAALMESHD